MRVAVMGVLAVALVSGCADDQAGREAGGQSLEEAVGFTQARWRALIEADDRAVTACMARRGYSDYDAETLDWRERAEAPHGLFEIFSPTSELAYLRTHGYGIAARIRGLQRASRVNSDDPELPDAATGDPAEQAMFEEALTGGARPEDGCLSAGPAAVRELGLPSEGELPVAYGVAIGDLHESGEYDAFERNVIGCMRAQGATVAKDDDLVSAQRPVLLEALQLVSADYEYDDDGAIHFSMKASALTPAVLRRLPGLRERELRVARLEARCRQKFNSDMHALMVRFTGPLVRQYAAEVSALRSALMSARKQEGS